MPLASKQFKVKNERIFVFFYKPKEGMCRDVGSYTPNDIGRSQFIAHQSRGVVPNNPDPYYIVLSDGKRSADYLTSEYKNLFRSIDIGVSPWWGFYQLWVDWEGSRWVLPYLIRWFCKGDTNHADYPSWVSCEGATI